MKKLGFYILLCLISLFLFSGIEIFAWSSEAITDLDKRVTTVDQAIGSKIDVAVSSSYEEEDPAVAVCGDYYLVVYEREGDIYGQRVDDDGSLVGGLFLISGGSGNDHDPDVSCLWPTIFDQMFVVVWTHDYYGDGTDFDILSQAIALDGTRFGSRRTVAYSANDELKPSIACEEDDYYCIVIFEYDETGVVEMRGQRLHLTNFDLEIEGDQFNPGSSTTYEEGYPSVTWSMGREEYFVTWQRWTEYPGGDHNRVVYSFIYEDEQGVNPLDEVKGGPYGLLPTGIGYDEDQLQPVVAYNNISGHYLVVFVERDVDYKDVLGVLLSGTTLAGGPYRLTEEVYGEGTAVAYSGGPGGATNAEDEFLVTYTRLLSDWQLEGAFVWQDTQQDRDLLIAMGATFNHVIYDTDVTGYSVTGTYLVVWGECDSQDPWDCNVYGQRYGNGLYYKAYLPFIIGE